MRLLGDVLSLIAAEEVEAESVSLVAVLLKISGDVLPEVSVKLFDEIIVKFSVDDNEASSR